MSEEIEIRKACNDDADALWQMFQEVVELGGSFLEDGSETRDTIVSSWLTPPADAFVACLNDRVVGAYKLRPNHAGYGSHVANGSYMVALGYRDRKIGRRLGEHSLNSARSLGYRALQFNAVISTNTAAIRLWTDLGFSVAGRVPRGFIHDELGEHDLLIMHRFL